MAQSFKYVVLTAVPDRGRGERVNVGLMIFAPGGLDVRLAELDKIKALTGSNWRAYADDMKLRLLQRFHDPEEAIDEVQNFRRIDPYFDASDIAWFTVSQVEAYESAVRSLLKGMVLCPEERIGRMKSTRINTQIAKVLRQARALAEQDESFDTHRVQRNFEIEDELSADFVQKNGVWRIATTLDCSRSTGVLKEASLKAVTLDRASAKFGSDTKRLGIYNPGLSEDRNARAAFNILREYSDVQFNWADIEDRRRLVNYFYAGMGATGTLI